MLILLLLATLFLVAPMKADEPAPVIVELFTSEGCSSCPPADVLLKRLAQKQEIVGAMIIPLGFHVDYWDELGWKDRFSSPLFTARQRDYAKALKLRGPYTPQMIVAGTIQFVGSDEQAARNAISRAAKDAVASISIESKRVDQDLTVNLIAPTMKDNTDLFIAITQDNLSSKVERGENAGKDLPHAAVVREFKHLDANEVKSSIRLDRGWNLEDLHIVAFVQQKEDRRIIAAGTSRVK